MKIQRSFAVMLMILTSIGALAQKPFKPAGDFQGTSRVPLSNAELNDRFQTEKGRRHLSPLKADYKELIKTPLQNRRMKADPADVPYTQKIDSVYYFIPDALPGEWVPNGAEYYLFDTKGRNYAFWSAWYDQQLLIMVPDSKTSMTYSGDNIASETYSSWLSGRWEPYYRTLYTFDANGNQVTYVSQGWDMGWINYNLDSIAYTGSGKVSSETSHYWDGQVWYPSYRVLYEYDGKDNLVRESSAYWYVDVAPRWETQDEVLYTYDGFNRPVSEVQRYWDTYLLEWYNSDSTRYHYDASGNLTLQEVYNWNGEIFIWDPYWKEEYAYDASNRLIQSVYYNSAWFSTTWYILDKYEYLLDANGNVLEETYFLYDTATLQYTPDWKDVYEYDLSVDVQSIAMPYWYGMEYVGEDGRGGESNPLFANKVTGYKEMLWNPQILDFEISEVDSIYYSGFYDSPINDAACQANFLWALDETDNKTVHFTDLSDSTVVSWYWIFGDGHTSTRKNPKNQYTKPGTYRVILTTVDESGFCSNTMVRQIVVGNPACNASFTYLLDTANLQVTMTNLSEGSGLKYYWNFGDGSVDKDINPSHKYENPGTYLVTLTVSNALGDCADRYTALVRAAGTTCNPEFAVYVDSTNNTAYFRVKKVATGNQYYWKLGDGSTGKTANLIHTFDQPGYYSATLTVYNGKALCLESRKETFLVGGKSQGARAEFSYLANDDNSVEFTNRSIGQELKYVWDFNDGETSEDTDPKHNYLLPGYYTVCLTAFNPSDGSQDMYCEKIFAGTNTVEQCQARFEYVLGDGGFQIDCRDRSFGQPNRWLWTYNNDWSTEEKDPSWNVGAPSYVRIQQTVWNASGCRDDAHALVNMGAEDRLKAGFIVMEDTSVKKAETYPKDFVGISLGDAGKLKWSFGDGTFDSTTVNPTHIYAQPGVYNVCLTVTNTSTGESDTDCQDVWVGWSVSLDDLDAFAVGLKAYPNPFRENTRIEIVLGEETPFDLSVYDLLGRKVMTIAADSRPAGTYRFDLDGSGLEGGSYYLILETDLGRAERQISLIK